MTKDQVLSLQPGRELDALVAEKVMGLTGIFNVADSWFYSASIKKILPLYSTDISVAWEVVEKIDDGQHEIVITKAPYYDDVWITTISKFEEVDGEYVIDRTHEVHTESKSLPEAICKAALLAVMEELPQAIETTAPLSHEVTEAVSGFSDQIKE